MYPADDILIRVRLATEHARALKASIETHLARSRTLQERALSGRYPSMPCDAALVADISEVVRTSRLLLEDAREHRRRCQLLVEQPRRRRQGVAEERE
ncbi:MAG TPA: hypothetical protein VF584_14855 [Longimicrobium sp.]|jgi:hypothetical protein